MDLLDCYWNLFTSHIGSEKIIGLGMNWIDSEYFDYAIVVINDEVTSKKIKKLDFSKTSFDVNYVEISLPDFDEWETFKGKEKDLRQIYEKEFVILI